MKNTAVWNSKDTLQQHSSDQELNEQINDKLNELWKGMKNKKKHLLHALQSQQSSQLNNPNEQLHQQTVNIPQQQQSISCSSTQIDGQLAKMRKKLAAEVENSKHKDLEIEMLKKSIVELNNDKNMLSYELQHYSLQDAKGLNQSSIASVHRPVQQSRQKGDASEYRNNPSKNCKVNTIVEEQQDVQPLTNHKLITEISKNRLVQLLRATAQYRQFIYYYDSHELSYLRKIQDQHRKNCEHSLGKTEKNYWAPKEILLKMHYLNQTEKMGLGQAQIETILSEMKNYYEKNQQSKLMKMKQEYHNKIRKLQRQNQNAIPYDLVQIRKVKQRQLSNNKQKKKNPKLNITNK